jgi:TPR repeat protein
LRLLFSVSGFCFEGPELKIRIFHDTGNSPMKNPFYLYSNALKHFRALAGRGDADAQMRLGMMYENGQGVPKNYSEAARWYRKAADKENPTAMFRLGMLLANGQGVGKDRAAACRYLEKAAQKGLDASREVLEKLSREMSPEECSGLEGR